MKFLYTLLLALFIFPCNADDIKKNDWRKITDGLESWDGDAQYEGKTYKATAVKIDMNYFNAKIIGSYNYFTSLDGADSIGRPIKVYDKEIIKYHEFSISDFLSENKDSYIVVSAGYLKDKSNPIPFGLLKEKSKTLSKYSEEYKYMSAVLCINPVVSNKKEVTVPIVYETDNSKDEEINKCSSAVQVGPRIIERFYKKGIISEKEDQNENRIIFSIGDDDKVYLYYFEKISLYNVQNLLLSKYFGEKSYPKYATNISLKEMAGMTIDNNNYGQVENITPALIVFEKNITQKDKK